MSKTNFKVHMRHLISALRIEANDDIFSELWNLLSRVPMVNYFWWYFRELFISLAFRKCKKMTIMVWVFLVQGFCPFKTLQLLDSLSHFVLKCGSFLYSSLLYSLLWRRGWGCQKHFSRPSLPGCRKPVVRKVDNNIHRINHYSQQIAWLVLLTRTHWKAIYPMDSVIQRLNNWGQVSVAFREILWSPLLILN